MKTIYNLNKELDQKESIGCFKTDGCLLNKCIIPFVNNIIKPIYKYILRPIGRGFKKLFKCIIIPIESCTIGSVIIGTNNNSN